MPDARCPAVENIEPKTCIIQYVVLGISKTLSKHYVLRLDEYPQGYFIFIL